MYQQDVSAGCISMMYQQEVSTGCISRMYCKPAGAGAKFDGGVRLGTPPGRLGPHDPPLGAGPHDPPLAALTAAAFGPDIGDIGALLSPLAEWVEHAQTAFHAAQYFFGS